MAAREPAGMADHEVLRRAGDASVLILTSLADGAKHGYALIQDIKGFAGLQLGPGTLYGALDRLERMGLIEALPAQDRRQPYRITAAGAVALRAHLDSIERVSSVGRLRLGLGGI
jgi:DNA-binding PadR family transcriptional regulator